MAFDGITIANIVRELQERLAGGRIYKIAQPECDELLITIKTAGGGQTRLFLSADASLPLVYLTDKNKPSPMTAPGFCMLLRKHIQNGRITDISQPGLERVIRIQVEHLNEMGDLCRKTLVIEIMGKHSNLIFLDDKDVVIDSIKHISGMVSSVREVLPGRPYFIPQTQEKADPLALQRETFLSLLTGKGAPVYKALYGAYTGISPLIAQELCHRAGIDGGRPAASLDSGQLGGLFQAFDELMRGVKNGSFAPNIVYERKMPVEYASVPLTLYSGDDRKLYQSISALLEQYYAGKNAVARIRQKSAELRRIVQTALERNIKKYDLQLQKMKDTEKKEKYKVYGELLNTYGYSVEAGSKSMEALNYYTDQTITIPLDPTLTPSENARNYFDKYGKLKRTYEALSELTREVKAEIDHLESIAAALDIAKKEEDLIPIKEELIENGYIRRKGGTRKPKVTSRPFHYLSSDGFSIYVGKNNFQNDELTFQLSSGNDWWFHAKGIPGSHVLVHTGGEEPPDRTFEEAARLAAFYSKGRGQEKVEIDYTRKKNVKKPNGSKPGFVVYYTNFSMMIDTDISGIRECEET